MNRKIHMRSPSTKKQIRPRRHYRLEWKHKCPQAKFWIAATCFILPLLIEWRHWLPCRRSLRGNRRMVGQFCPAHHNERHPRLSLYEEEAMPVDHWAEMFERRRTTKPCFPNQTTTRNLPRMTRRRRFRMWSNQGLTPFNGQAPSHIISKIGLFR